MGGALSHRRATSGGVLGLAALEELGVLLLLPIDLLLDHPPLLGCEVKRRGVKQLEHGIDGRCAAHSLCPFAARGQSQLDAELIPLLGVTAHREDAPASRSAGGQLQHYVLKGLGVALGDKGFESPVSLELIDELPGG